MIEFVKLVEHSSDKYPPRTYHNAKVADLTVAIAADYSSAGEKLTNKAAGEKYLRLDLDTNVVEASKILNRAIKNWNVKTLNIAGNGIYTLTKHGYTQDYVNSYIWKILCRLDYDTTLEKVVSGGQTGIDFAAGVACEINCIPCTMTFPKGYLQRFTFKDIIQSKEIVLTRLDEQVERLRKDIELESYT
jgi:hypothetical protein